MGEDAEAGQNLESKTPKLCDLMGEVYDRTQALFAQHDMLELP